MKRMPSCLKDQVYLTKVFQRPIMSNVYKATIHRYQKKMGHVRSSCSHTNSKHTSNIYPIYN